MNILKSIVWGAIGLCVPLASASDIVDRSGGPYVPTPQTVVDKMLETAGVGAGDFVIDLGSGDGRIVLTAATRYKAGGMGVDIDAELVDRANASARQLGVADRVQFHVLDVLKADVSKATVMTLYLLPGMMANLRRKLLAELRPGARIVSHDFVFDEWKPDRTVTVETQEKYDMTGTWTSDVHLWVVPAAVQGAWRGRWSGRQGEEFQLDIKQGYQHFEGRLERDSRTLELKDGQLDGARFSFTVPAANGRRELYTGLVAQGRIQGEVRDGEMVIARWSATRVP
jgi:16S rRNA G966 N2-methylase RsmD